ncbi:MAG: hypothetical protein JSR81_08690, partial [Proteobacteria bacterium]|nr:hypothetical protein [Pseudomonadota bacterium]
MPDSRLLLEVSQANVQHAPIVMADRRAENFHLGRLHGETAINRKRLPARADEGVCQARTDRPAIGADFRRPDGAARRTMADRSDQRSDKAIVANHGAIAHLSGNLLLQRMRREGQGRVEFVSAEDTVVLSSARHGPDAGEMRAAIVRGEASADLGLGNRHHKIG